MRKLVLLLMLLTLALPVLAQGEAIQLGQPVSGVMDDANSQYRYTFTGTQGQNIYVTAGAEYTTSLRVVGPTGTLLGEVEDWYPLVGPLTLAADGQYTIVINRPDWEEAGGNFALLVDAVEIVDMTNAQHIERTLPYAGATLFLSYSGEAGDIVSYQAEGAALRIQMRTFLGDIIIDEGVYDTPGRAVNLLPETGVYFGFIQTYNPTGTGFTLDMTSREVIGVQPGEPFVGVITDEAPIIFSFDSSAEKVWSISARVDAQPGQSNLIVYKPDFEDSYGWELATDCCRGPNGTPRIEPFEAPEDGTYYVVLDLQSWGDGLESGTYEFLVAASTLVSLVPGNTVTGEISPESGAVSYGYGGTAGEAITVSLSRIDGDAPMGLTVSGPGGDVMTFISYMARDLSVTVILPEDAQYRVEVFSEFYGEEPTRLAYALRLETQ